MSDGSGWISEERIQERLQLLSKGLAKNLSKVPFGDLKEHSGLRSITLKSAQAGIIRKELISREYVILLLTIEDSKVLTFGQARFGAGVHGHKRLKKPLKDKG